MNMLLEWDEEKRQKNIEKHGFDFDIAESVLSDPNAVIEIDNRKDYGEDRYWAFAKVDNQNLCLCYTMRGEIYRVISLYKANKSKWGKYYGENS